MRTIVITMPESVDREAERISAMLDGGDVEYVHLRKPAWTIDAMERLVRAIPESLHHRLKLHSCFGLLSDYELGGAHLNSRWPAIPEEVRMRRPDIKLSCSRHSLDEVIAADKQGGWEYVTLSPVFTSISKPDYPANALLRQARMGEQLRRLKTPVVALGGVTPDRFAMLERLGYSGAAMLGYAWQHLY